MDTTEETRTQKAGRVARLLSEYCRDGYGDPDDIQTAIADMMTDLMHLSDVFGRFGFTVDPLFQDDDDATPGQCNADRAARAYGYELDEVAP